MSRIVGTFRSVFSPDKTIEVHVWDDFTPVSRDFGTLGFVVEGKHQGADIVIGDSDAIALRDALNARWPDALAAARSDGYDEGLVDGLTDYGNFPS